MRTAPLPNPGVVQVLLTLITRCYKKPETLVFKSQNKKKNQVSDVNLLISEAPSIILQAEDNLSCWVLSKT